MASVSKEPIQQGPSPSSAEDELWKRSTDCVYFLASPLTCKKGSECEYRHSEAARNNPRDCYYWFSGTCSLNAKCAFRHPPLDVLMPPQAGNYAGPSPIPFSGPPFSSIPQNAAKQAVPCVFFQKGCCTKGDSCSYLHGRSIPVPNTKIQPVPATAAATEAPTFQRTFGGPEKGPQPKMSIYSNVYKSIETPRQPQADAALKVVKPLLMEGAPAAKRYPPRGVIEDTSKFKETVSPPAGNGSLRSRTAYSHRASLVDEQNYQNGGDVDDSLRESSPGFDVLVDDKLGEDDIEYYQNEDQYVRMKGHEGRRSSEYAMGRHDDFNSVTDVDHDVHHSKRGYRAYDDLRDKYPREQREASFERPTSHDRRGPYKPESTDFIKNSSDLRHRLSMQRRSNGLRSVVSPDYKPDHHPEDRGYRNSRRDTRRSPIRESSFGSRLQGRIKLPRRSPSASVGNMYSERDNERGRNSGRLSPRRPQLSSLQGRLRDRLGERIQEESNEGINFSGQIRRDSTFQANGDAFTGPRRLSEPRGTKHTDNKQQSVSGGKLRDSVLASSLGNEADISFDGPMPLSEILKRKRNAARTPSSGVVNKEGNKQNAPEQTQCDVQENNEPLIAEGGDEEDAEISNKKVKLIEDDSSFPDDGKHLEAEEEGLLGGDGEGPEVDEGFDQVDGEEPEVDEEFDQGDGEYDYEQDDDVEGYNLNEGDVADNEGFMDEDDGDDFAKKLGVSF